MKQHVWSSVSAPQRVYTTGFYPDVPPGYRWVRYVGRKIPMPPPIAAHRCTFSVWPPP